jgi:hypothetical protein
MSGVRLRNDDSLSLVRRRIKRNGIEVLSVFYNERCMNHTHAWCGKELNVHDDVISNDFGCVASIVANSDA